jgi:Icc-related predicted phosphoesterase
MGIAGTILCDEIPKLKILAISDVEQSTLYGPQIRDRFEDAAFVISCGDLPFDYLDYIISSLNKPLYYVHGNHSFQMEFEKAGQQSSPPGGTNLHRKALRGPGGWLLAGIEGCISYNGGPHQYTQTQMWNHVLSLGPVLMRNKLMYGRYLDVLVTHAAAWRVDDREDPAHQGSKALRWAIEVFKPSYHLHGHVHLYRRDEPFQLWHNGTKVVNVYGHRLLDVSATNTMLNKVGGADDNGR